MLKDTDCTTLIEKLIEEEKLKYPVPVYNIENLNTIPDDEITLTINDAQFLEILLLRIRGETIKYASYRKKVETQHEQSLISEIRSLECNQTLENSDYLDEKKVELEKIRQKTIEASSVRSRVQWLIQGEKPTKYFCSLEKNNYIEKTIKCIQDDKQNKNY